jgi:DNA-binding response OmpR family regulator/anti-sigma regulatory factor (Ser/Thr protein kinase)
MLGRDSARASILVVDDEPFSLDIVSECLGESYEVHALRDGRAAMHLLDQSGEQFDLVILDRCMRAPDGVDILRFIRESPVLAHLPVIMQSAAAGPDEVAEGIVAGADCYLTKPFRLAALSALVRTALRRAREMTRVRERALELESTMSLMNEGEFGFRSPNDAATLAYGLSGLCADADMVRIGLSELLLNAVEHGNLGIGFDRKGELLQAGIWHDELARRLQAADRRNREGVLHVKVDAEEVRFTIRDDGDGFDWRPYLDMPVSAGDHINGRGIALARKLAFPSLLYREGGRVVQATATPKPRWRS